MQIRLKTILAGPNLNGQPGDILELTKKAAAPFLEGGFADQLDAEGNVIPMPSKPAPPENDEEGKSEENPDASKSSVEETISDKEKDSSEGEQNPVSATPQA
jgi:hypothetical protein